MKDRYIGKDTNKTIEDLDIKERRILRALFDENSGRSIYNYEKYYNDEINRLLNLLGYIRKSEGKYLLTAKGEEITRHYLLQTINKKA